MSPPAVQSTWCHWELGQAATLKKRVIPVLLRDCVIPEVVKNIQFADFRQGANAEAIGSLANGLYRTIEISTAYALEAPEPDGLPPNYYSVFISFSSEDMEFAYRLYEDLRKNGVECYFSPEDLKIGDKFWDEIEEKIQRYDKLLVILSESSVGSDWVRDEVEGGLERERENDEKVLFPIRFDNSVTDSRARWARRIHRKRHIGDFTQWKEHDAYQRSFRRLLRDLEPSNE